MYSMSSSGAPLARSADSPHRSSAEVLKAYSRSPRRGGLILGGSSSTSVSLACLEVRKSHSGSASRAQAIATSMVEYRPAIEPGVGR